MTKVRWGGLATAKIAREKVIPGLMQSEHAVLHGVAFYFKSMDDLRITKQPVPNMPTSWRLAKITGIEWWCTTFSPSPLDRSRSFK